MTSTSTSASSAPGSPASRWRAKWRSAAGRWRCWRETAWPGPPPDATPALSFPASTRTSTAWSSASASITPSSYGRCRSRASPTCAAPSRKPACRGSIRSTAGCRCRKPTTGARRARWSSGCAGSAPMSRPGRPSRCAHCCRAGAISARCITAAPSISIRSITRSASPPPRRPPARASSSRRQRCRSIRAACASASPRPRAACARRRWCSPAMCISAR